MKPCKQCGSKDRYPSRGCRPCVKKQATLYQRATPERRRRGRRAKTAFWNRYKISAGCFDCGYNAHPEALHFDHVTGVKRYSISQMSDLSWKTVLKEIEKCEVRCANCHAVATSKRR